MHLRADKHEKESRTLRVFAFLPGSSARPLAFLYALESRHHLAFSVRLFLLKPLIVSTWVSRFEAHLFRSRSFARAKIGTKRGESLQIFFILWPFSSDSRFSLPSWTGRTVDARRDGCQETLLAFRLPPSRFMAGDPWSDTFTPQTAHLPFAPWWMLRVCIIHSELFRLSHYKVPMTLFILFFFPGGIPPREKRTFQPVQEFFLLYPDAGQGRV